ncbi:MAG: hypothetical protein ACTSSF_06300 [Candidatus Heimdallarchaeaceae archaeon]
MEKKYDKKATIFIFSIIFLIPFLSIPIHSNTTVLNSNPIEIPAIDDLYFNHSVDINIVSLVLMVMGLPSNSNDLFNALSPIQFYEQNAII